MAAASTRVSRLGHGLPFVVLVNSDLVVKLRVVTHKSIAIRGRLYGVRRFTLGLVSEPCGAPTGNSCASTPDRRASALRQTPQADHCGSTALGVALFCLAGMEVWRPDNESVHGRWMASERLSLIL